MTTIENTDESTTNINANGFTARALGAGAGPLVIVMGAGFGGGGAQRALAKRFRVLAIETAETDARTIGEGVAAWAKQQGDGKVGLIGFGAHAGAALFAAHALAEQAAALVLASPALPLGTSADDQSPLTPLLRGVLAAKLVIIGSEDHAMPRDALTVFKKGLSRANVAVVYGAGNDIAAERPDAFANLAGDFLDRQERFRFVTNTVAVSP